MITLQHEGGIYTGKDFVPGRPKPENREATMAHGILKKHNHSEDMQDLRIKFDALASHDITYVGIIQTARASGLTEFPVPYVLTNCHNSLCAVGGTLNEDDHVFGLSAAKKYGGVFVPAHLAVIHQYMREMYAGCGRMILGSDSHTRYGAIGTLAVGEGGPEIVKQLLGRTWDIAYPDVVAVNLTGKPQPGVGPQDVALAIIGRVFENGFVKNSIMEFVGEGIGNLSMDFRIGIDVMTTETACLSSIWETDDKTREFLAAHGRAGDYAKLTPGENAWYDRVLHVDLSRIRPMIALPFHPSNAYAIADFKENMADILAETEKKLESQMGHKPDLLSKMRGEDLYVDQGIVAGCSGGMFENIARMADILKGRATGNGEFALSVYPSSQPQYLEIMRRGYTEVLMEAGALLHPAFCGPCFGAGDTPANGAFSIRHTTRNFQNREGAKPNEGQEAYVALMDARSIAATAANGGKLTAADELDIRYDIVPEYSFDKKPYESRVYQGFGKPDAKAGLVFGPNIADWPRMPALPENLVLITAAAIYDPVTTTDELIPSGETSTFRSNPMRLASFALSRRDPGYVGRAQDIAKKQESLEKRTPEAMHIIDRATGGMPGDYRNYAIGSLLFALRPGDGSAREQAASVQRVLGGWGNLCEEFATKRYRSNVINWGMVPLTTPGAAELNVQPGDILYLQGIRKILEGEETKVPAVLIQGGARREIELSLPPMTRDERDVVLAGCLINYYAAKK